MRMALNLQRRRHPEAPRFLQRGEGSREGGHRAMARFQMLNPPGLRDDAFSEARR